eukprot:9428832-Lingulodinium_polyedra.AAC.1
MPKPTTPCVSPTVPLQAAARVPPPPPPPKRAPTTPPVVKTTTTPSVVVKTMTLEEYAQWHRTGQQGTQEGSGNAPVKKSGSGNAPPMTLEEYYQWW